MVEVHPPAEPLPAEPLDAVAIHPHPRGPNVEKPPDQWTTVTCDKCGALAGQYKSDVCPGGRDPPIWMVRVRDGEQWAAIWISSD